MENMKKIAMKTRIAALVSGLAAVVALVYFFIKTQGLSIVERLPVLVPVACAGVLMITVILVLSLPTKKQK